MLYWPWRKNKWTRRSESLELTSHPKSKLFSSRILRWVAPVRLFAVFFNSILAHNTTLRSAHGSLFSFWIASFHRCAGAVSPPTVVLANNTHEEQKEFPFLFGVIQNQFQHSCLQSILVRRNYWHPTQLYRYDILHCLLFRQTTNLSSNLIKSFRLFQSPKLCSKIAFAHRKQTPTSTAMKHIASEKHNT